MGLGIHKNATKVELGTVRQYLNVNFIIITFFSDIWNSVYRDMKIKNLNESRFKHQKLILLMFDNMLRLGLFP